MKNVMKMSGYHSIILNWSWSWSLGLCLGWVLLDRTCSFTRVHGFSSPIPLDTKPPYSRKSFGDPIRNSKFQFLSTCRSSSHSSHSSSSLHSSHSSSSSSSLRKKSHVKVYQHILAILTVPRTSMDRIANEAILETCMTHARHHNHNHNQSHKSPPSRLSIVLRRQDGHLPPLNELRGYVGEIYSMAWDCALGFLDEEDEDAEQHETNEKEEHERNEKEKKNETEKKNSPFLLNVIVYPQNLPNTAPERWIYHRPDLDCICSHDSITGWVSHTQVGNAAAGHGIQYQQEPGKGRGGLVHCVEAINRDRKVRGLTPLEILPVDHWPAVCQETASEPSIHTPQGARGGGKIVFLEDSPPEKRVDPIDSSTLKNLDSNKDDMDDAGQFLMGASYQITSSSSLFHSVAVGGTFDGMHYGHRKLLTLAISSVLPNTGKLLIGITTDSMLQSKAYADYIPPLQERIQSVRDFIDSLAPGMKNRVKIVPIRDKYGPPGADRSSNVYAGIPNDFDALVLSHETLATGQSLNQHRILHLGLPPLTLLCTRRTEAHGMSSTALRRMKKQMDDMMVRKNHPHKDSNDE